MQYNVHIAVTVNISHMARRVVRWGSFTRTKEDS